MTATAPRTSYLICTTPRSGSTLLCELLAQTGIAGLPEEYFQQLRSTGAPMTPRDYLHGVAADLVPPLDPARAAPAPDDPYDPRRYEDFEEYLGCVLRNATTPNGVFAAKIMWPYVAGLVAGLGTIPRYRHIEGPAALLSSAFPGLRYVWLRRYDKVRQAVSLWRAIQTWRWRQDAFGRSEQTPAAELRYSFEAVDHLRRTLIAADRAWELYFEGTGIKALTLSYEDFVPNMHETVAKLLDFAGIDCPPGTEHTLPRTARQSDSLSEQWVAEFRGDFALRVPAVR